MTQTLEAIIHPDGSVRFVEPLLLQSSRRALVTLLDDDPHDGNHDRESALLSEAALAVDWSRSEEDAAWAHLQPVKSF